MNLSSCKSRALFVLSVLSFMAVMIDPTYAAIISITRDMGSRPSGDSELIHSSFGSGGRYGRLNSFAESFSITTDTVANTASFSEMRFGNVTVTGGGTRSQSSTTVTPPTDFPDPPIFNTATFTETVTLNPISPTNVLPRFISSTTGAVTYQNGYRYQFPANVVFEFPDSFTVSGTYKMQGPTETATVPFSMLYSRVGSASVIRPSTGFIDVGTNFPDTASITASVGSSATYRPASNILFNGTVNGQLFRIEFLEARLFAGIPIPEPATWLYALAAISLVQPHRRFSQQRRIVTVSGTVVI